MVKAQKGLFTYKIFFSRVDLLRGKLKQQHFEFYMAIFKKKIVFSCQMTIVLVTLIKTVKYHILQLKICRILLTLPTLKTVQYTPVDY